MQGASREAMAQAWSGVERLLSTPDVDAAQVGEELFAVVDLLDGQVALRRALSDPALEAGQKASLVESVLGSRVSAPTLQIVGDLVRARWSRMRDLPDAIETLAVLAMLTAAERDGQADDVEDELFRFARIVESRPALRDALSSRALPNENKTALVDALLGGGKATETTLVLVTQLATHPRGRSPEDALADYGQIAARRRERFVARVTTAIPLTDDERERLATALAGLYGHDVHLHAEVDEDVIGGVVVQVGDEVLDGSVAGRLDRARQQLE
ncbi:MAG: F-type H+-transporting ATPase subunit delta [Actinomycetota bacterium]|jgi:F-type H+-transporting ATPase subunit delta|nr:F-type H+-transporting ATPase subunit delta [Actinomycetota bacterium]